MIQEIKHLNILKSYLLFNLLVVTIHICLVSTASFFHFLLEHELGIIEDWLIKNTWLILFLDKLLAFIIFSYFVQFRFDVVGEIKLFFRESFNFRLIGFAIFILTSFYALIEQFGGGINKNELKENLVVSILFFSSFFYLFDFIFLYYMRERFFEISRGKIVLLGIVLFLIHKLTEQVILPQIKAYEVIYFIHFITLFLFVIRKEFYSILAYSFLIVAPMTAFWGIDLVWDNAYSVYAYDKSIPIVGIVGIWSIGVIYLYYKEILAILKKNSRFAKNG